MNPTYFVWRIPTHDSAIQEGKRLVAHSRRSLSVTDPAVTNLSRTREDNDKGIMNPPLITQAVVETEESR
jgi:hypothetical protein